MGLIGAATRLASRHAHVLVVAVPGHWATRAAVERHALARGWRLAVSPADADVLAVCGRPGDRLASAIDLVWHQLPGPRVRIDVEDGAAASARLDVAHAALLDTDAHRDDAKHRPGAEELLPSAAEHAGHDGHDVNGGDAEHEGHGGQQEHGEHSGHEGHEGHEGHGEMAPSGIALAGGGEDRDGLEMDVLSLPLGPVLPFWPEGLVIRCTLQGDLVHAAEPDFLDADAQEADRPTDGGARGLDNVLSLLALAGWTDATAEARRIRDDLLEHGAGSKTSAALRRLFRRVRRSRILRWSLRGLRPVTPAEIEREGLPGTVAGDTYDRLLRMLDGVEREVAGGEGADLATAEGSATTPAQLARLVTGLDLAAARLVVASLDVRELAADHPTAGGAHA